MILLLFSALTASGVPGPYNLVLRWGSGSPLVVRYIDQSRCELAAGTVLAQRDPIVDRSGRARPVPPETSGANAPYAFCVPA
jgi:hypothetical protein